MPFQPVLLKLCQKGMISMVRMEGEILVGKAVMIEPMAVDTQLYSNRVPES